MDIALNKVINSQCPNKRMSIESRLDHWKVALLPLNFISIFLLSSAANFGELPLFLSLSSINWIRAAFIALSVCCTVLVHPPGIALLTGVSYATQKARTHGHYPGKRPHIHTHTNVVKQARLRRHYRKLFPGNGPRKSRGERKTELYFPSMADDLLHYYALDLAQSSHVPLTPMCPVLCPPRWNRRGLMVVCGVRCPESAHDLWWLDPSFHSIESSPRFFPIEGRKEIDIFGHRINNSTYNACVAETMLRIN